MAPLGWVSGPVVSRRMAPRLSGMSSVQPGVQAAPPREAMAARRSCLGWIQAATVNAADLLGLSGEVGSIEPGKRADIIAVDGDPLTDVTVLTSMDFVMRDGRVYRDEE